MQEKIHITVPIIVEGKYDKIKLSGVTDALILTTDGFGVFKNHEKTALIRRLSQRGVILLCDSDGAGSVIRSHLKGMLNGVAVYQLYTAQVPGKERRKAHASKEGYLGVEGISESDLAVLLAKLVRSHPELGTDGEPDIRDPDVRKPDVREMTKADFFALGLTGNAHAAERRDEVCLALGLPRGMTPNAMLAAVNLISRYDEVAAIVKKEDV